MLKNKEIVYLDCETTGLDSEYHEIISVCIIRKRDSRMWTFKAKPNWPDHIDPKAIIVNGYDPKQWEDGIDQEDLARQLSILLKDCVIIGHNPRFDIDFIVNLLWRYKQNTWIDHRGIDTTTLAYLYLVPWGLESLSMDSIRRFLGWRVHKTHEAIQDTKDVARLYEALTNPLERWNLYLKMMVSRLVARWKK
jgi:DNA polymerase III epsilon subunit-like protein